MVNQDRRVMLGLKVTKVKEETMGHLVRQVIKVVREIVALLDSLEMLCVVGIITLYLKTDAAFFNRVMLDSEELKAKKDHLELK